MTLTIVQLKVCIAVFLAVAASTAAAFPVARQLYGEHGPVEYHFKYSVHDDRSGDIKHQQEERHGDKVTGQYSLNDADGYRRVVDYTSDKDTGFVANVRRELIKGFHQTTSSTKAAVVPVVQLLKSLPLVPINPHIESFHPVEQAHYVKVHKVTPKLSEPIVYTSKNRNTVHSHTSFKSGNISYQY